MLYLSCRGILFFNQCIAFFVACFCNVSVPCRGILFFNEMTKEEQRQLAIEFPSPVGESYFSIMHGLHDFLQVRVSVPCRGILFFNSFWCGKPSIFPPLISVPYRGILFFNYCCTYHQTEKKNASFRPLSGNLIFQSWKCTCQKRPGLFPSPIGESYFSIVREYEKRNDRIVSVPYRGILFFNEDLELK